MDCTSPSPYLPTRRLRAAILVAVGALAAVSCADAPVGCCTLALAIRELSDRTLAPPGDFTPASFLVEGAGPFGASFSVEVTTPDVLVEGLAAGSWTLSATGRNAAGLPVARGETAAELTGAQTNEVTVVLRALAGSGTLEIEVLWDAQRAPSAVISGELLDSAGAASPIAFDQTGPGRAASLSGELQAGWYTLLIRLYDGAALVAGAAEATLIRAASVTTGSIDLRGPAPASPGAFGLAFSLELPSIRELVMAGQLAKVEPSQPMAVETYPSAELVQSWYLDGACIGSGAELLLAAPTTLGGHRLDTIGLDASRAGAAALSHPFLVLAAVEPGLLTPAHELADGSLGVQGLRGARAAALSPDGLRLYATGYDSDSIAFFDRSPATGMLRYAGRVTDGATGVEGMDGPEGLALSPDGRHLYVAGYTDDSIVALAVNAAGGLEPVGATVGLDGVRSLEVSPDGAYVYAALSGVDTLSVLSRDPATGTLVPVSAVVNGAVGVSLLQAPYDLALSPDGEHVYVAAYGSDTVLWLGRDSASGALSYLGAASDGVGGVEGLNGANGIAVTPDGLTVLVASYYDKALAWFSRDPVTGALGYRGSAADGVAGVDGLYYARDVAVSLAGDTVWVSGGGEDAVAVFRRDGPDAPLRFLEKVAVADGPRGLAASPDGKSLYVCSAGAGAITLMGVSP